MPDNEIRYCIDTSSLIHAWHRAYPQKNFPSFWAKLEATIEAGIVIASIEVLNELKKKDDDIHTWCHDIVDSFFVDIDDEIQNTLTYILGTYPRLVDTVKGRSEGDPFVIALAMSYNPPLTVVTQEGPGKANSPKIPDVCNKEGVPCINMVQFIQQLNWSF